MSGAAAPPVVVASHLSRSFGDTTVVNDLTLAVEEGQVHGFIGPSGSGKTTTVRMMTGVLAPTEGTVRVFGTDPTRLGTKDRKRLGYMPQMGVLYPELTVGDNLRFAASLYGVKKTRRRIAEVLALLDMSDTQKLRLDQASGGMQRRVALAAALLHEPQLLFLDEPTAGLDPVLRRTVWDHLGELGAGGCTVFVTTQIVSEAASCDRVCLIADGRVLADGPPDTLRREAAGGELVDLHLDARPDDATLQAVADHALVHRATRVEEDPRRVRVTVDAADDAIATLTPFMAERGNEVRLAERHVADFDDVFVGLLERHRG